jgi:diguanylate cyclase (GGDEF)-like protein/PAS domain S-box-containing protein
VVATDFAAANGGELYRLGLAPGNKRLFDALIAHAPVGVFVTDAEGACLYANAPLCALTGLPLDKQLGYGWREALHPDDVERVAAGWTEASREGTDVTQDQRFVRPDGAVAWVEMSASAVRGDDGRVVGWAGVCVDVTKRRESDDRYRQLVENARDAIYTADLGGDFVSVNQAAEEMTGFSREELLAMNFFDLIAPEDADHAQEALARSLAGEDDSRIELQLVARDGRRVHAEVTGRLVEEGGRPVRFEGIARDVTERKLLEEQLTHQAFHDRLTGLPNRALLLDRLGHALVATERAPAPIAVMLLDLDNFQVVNDALGHDAGDALLRAIALRLLQATSGSDTVARMGGDGFAFVVETLWDEREAIAVAERIAAAFEAPFTIGETTQRIDASLGIAFARPGDDPVTLLRNAGTALRSAKATRRGGFELYDHAMRGRLLRELEVRNALARALERHELLLHYQPIVSVGDGEVLGLEALVRWPHPEWGWVQPSEFIPIAEADGLIVELDRYVIGDAVRDAALWRRQAPDALPLGVFVNVSARQLATPDFVAFIRQTLHEQELAPEHLGIEITERVFVDESDDLVAENLIDLARLGVRLSLDDFGTGYSALASLKRFPFSVLKIDRFFIRTIRSTSDSDPISTAIVSLGKALGLTVVAEGVETDVQADYLRRIGCDTAQGFHYARPQPALSISASLQAHADPGDRLRAQLAV